MPRSSVGGAAVASITHDNWEPFVLRIRGTRQGRILPLCQRRFLVGYQPADAYRAYALAPGTEAESVGVPPPETRRFIGNGMRSQTPQNLQNRYDQTSGSPR